MSRFLLASFLFASTLPAAAGVSVGHPVPTVLAAANGLTFSEATLSVSQVDVETCSGQSDALIASQTADPVEGDHLAGSDDFEDCNELECDVEVLGP